MECKKDKNCCSLDIGRGCEFCHCGDEATAQMREGCFKLHATDWLADYPEVFPDDIFEVRFKNTRRSYYKNVNNLPLKRGDIVAVEASPGHDIGIVSLTGDLVAKQMKRLGFNPLNGEFKKIYRKAKPYDIEKWQEAIALEHETMIRSRQIAAEMGLNMKIGDVEYQGDKIKAIFYYIADERVDFRELIKVFAEQFRIRVEMKQIGARQEAGRIGGLGSCGRELCCASWISSFSSVTTNSARVQEISLNPQKLAGQCSKLKCCLIYELDTYLDARKDFPRIHQPLQTLDGEYFLVKTDILARTMSFSTSPNAMAGVITLPVSRVKEILTLNKQGTKVDRLEGEQPIANKKEEEPSFVNVIGEESITRFDKQRNGRNGNKSRSKKSRKHNDNSNNAAENNKTADSSESGKHVDAASGNNNNNNNNNRSGQNSEPRDNRPSKNRNDNRRRDRNGERPEGQSRENGNKNGNGEGNNTPQANSSNGNRNRNRRSDRRSNRPRQEGQQGVRTEGGPDQNGRQRRPESSPRQTEGPRQGNQPSDSRQEKA